MWCKKKVGGGPQTQGYLVLFKTTQELVESLLLQNCTVLHQI